MGLGWTLRFFLCIRVPLVLCAFVLSSRPNTAMLADDPSTDEHLTSMSPQRLMTPTVDNDTRPPATATADTVDVTADIAVSLVYHSSDFAVTPISDTTKVECCVIYVTDVDSGLITIILNT